VDLRRVERRSSELLCCLSRLGLCAFGLPDSHTPNLIQFRPIVVGGVPPLGEDDALVVIIVGSLGVD